MSNWGLGFFRYKTNQSYVKIDHKGDVINEFLTSYVKIGPISLFGRKRAEIIERGKPYCYYKNSIENTSEKSEEKRLKENCVKANSLNALTLEKNEYDHLLEYCFERSILKWKHIKDLYLRR